MTMGDGVEIKRDTRPGTDNAVFQITRKSVGQRYVGPVFMV